jgi:hypothetical protein
MSALLKAVPPLLVGLGGVGVALLWFYVSKPLAVAPPAAAVVLGLAADQWTKRTLARDDPVAATKWIYGWALVPFAVAIGAAGAAIVLAVALDPGDKPPVKRKEVFSAAVAAVGAFLIAAFIKSADEADEKWVGSRFKKRFQARFRDRFPREQGKPASQAELAVLSEADLGFSGWGRAARSRRAEIVAQELAAG